MDNSNRIITSNMFLPNIAQVFEFFFVSNLHFLIRYYSPFTMFLGHLM